MQNKENAKSLILSIIKKSKKENIRTIVLEDRIDKIIEEIIKETENRILQRLNSKK